MPNSFAILILLAWPLVAGVLYLQLRTLPATFWTLVGGYLFLPVGVRIDLPLVPALDKELVPAVSAALCLYLIKGVKIPWLGGKGWLRIVVLVMLALPFLSVLNNPEGFTREETFYRGLGLYDGLSNAINMYVQLLPMLIGLAIIKGKADFVEVCKLTVLSALAYSVLVIFELRFSPQLHAWIYGYHPHSFAQQVRGGGFRAMVFVGHGLLISIYIAFATVVAAAALRSGQRLMIFSNMMILGFLLLVLVLSKSMGAFLLGGCAVATMLIAGPGLFRIAIWVILTLVVSYPLLSMMNLNPLESFALMIESSFPDRTQSLMYRLYHEGRLLELAWEKPITGWGGFGRARYEDSVTDGFWIITVGNFGLMGLFGLGALLITPIRALMDTRLEIPGDRFHWLCKGYALALGILLADQIPNASAHGYFWLWFGCGLGAARVLLAEAKERREAPVPRRIVDATI